METKVAPKEIFVLPLVNNRSVESPKLKKGTKERKAQHVKKDKKEKKSSAVEPISLEKKESNVDKRENKKAKKEKKHKKEKKTESDNIVVSALLPETKSETIVTLTINAKVIVRSYYKAYIRKRSGKQPIATMQHRKFTPQKR